MNAGNGECTNSRNLDKDLPHTGFETPLWQRGFLVAGVDEAGRGPLAGPVVAAAVIFPSHTKLEGVRDSKALTPSRRETLFERIHQTALAVSIGIADHDEIDRINILRATHRAMTRAVEGLSLKPDHVLIDGKSVPDFHFVQTAVCGGDRLCFSIAAASIVAKVTRDRLMLECDRLYPTYGFGRHKGYGTRDHVEMIRIHGFCPIHRKTFHVRGWRKEEKDGRRTSEERAAGRKNGRPISDPKGL
ncbi:MAG TPA: ribonuclease HII [bacterium]|nr:ribonuclease HII [bacterium]